MGIFSRMFGTEKAVDAGISALDKVFYTTEEKADHSLRMMEAKSAFLKSYVPFKLAQRFLAMIYSIPYALAWLATWAASFFMDVTVQKELLSDSDIAMANLIILGFYFGGGAAESIFKYARPVVIKK